MRRTTAALVERAERAGAVRPDLDSGDLLLVVSGIALTGVAGEDVDRLLEIVQRGIRPAAATREDGRTA